MKSVQTLSIDPSMPIRARRNKLIQDEYKRQFAEGKRTAVILTALSEKFHLREDTIERIVFERGYYKGATGGATA